MMFFKRYKIYELLIVSVVNSCFTFNVIANEFKDQQQSEQYITAPKHVPQYSAEAVQSERIKRKIFKLQQDDQESNKNTSWYTKFTSWLPSSNCLRFNKKPNRQLVYCVLAGTTWLLIDYATAQSASTASNAPPPPSNNTPPCELAHDNFILNIVEVCLLTAGAIGGTAFGVIKICYSNAINNYNPDYGHSKGACLRNFCVTACSCCCSEEQIEAYRIHDDHADTTVVSLQNNLSAPAASGNLQTGLLGAPVNNNVFNLSGGNPSGNPSHIFNLGNTNTVHSTGFKSKKQLAGNSKRVNSHYRNQQDDMTQDDVAIDIKDGTHPEPPISVSSSSTVGPTHHNVDIQDPINNHVVDIKNQNDNNEKNESPADNSSTTTTTNN